MNKIVEYLGLPLPEKPGYRIQTDESGECLLVGTVYQPAPLVSDACLNEIKIPLGKSSAHPLRPFPFDSFLKSLNPDASSGSMCEALPPVIVSDAKIASLVAALSNTGIIALSFYIPLTEAQQRDTAQLSHALQRLFIAGYAAHTSSPYQKL